MLCRRELQDEKAHFRGILKHILSPERTAPGIRARAKRTAHDWPQNPVGLTWTMCQSRKYTAKISNT